MMTPTLTALTGFVGWTLFLLVLMELSNSPVSTVLDEVGDQSLISSSRC